MYFKNNTIVLNRIYFALQQDKESIRNDYYALGIRDTVLNASFYSD